MSPDSPNDHTTAQLVPDMSALDAALREVLSTTPQIAEEPEQAPAKEEPRLALDQTMDVVHRAAATIDELIERNRSITEAAVRSVEFFRAQAGEYRSESERLREELRVAKERGEAQRATALAQAAAAKAEMEELEAELAARSAELADARAWIAEINAQIEKLLGGAQEHLRETADGNLFA